MERLKNYLTLEGWGRDLGETMSDVKGIFWKAILVYALASLPSHNGCLDSRRTNEAREFQNPQNPIAVVADVKERWKDNSPFAAVASAFGGGGYNPKVIRNVTFTDGTKTELHYRVLAHQPFRRWINGKEFEPKPGETYEVTHGNTMVRRIR